MSQKPETGKTPMRSGIKPPTTSISARREQASGRRTLPVTSITATPSVSASSSRLARPTIKEVPEVIEQPKQSADVSPPIQVPSPTVKELAQQISNKNPTAPSPIYQNVSEATEVELLRTETKDLKEKLETLRIKRREDQEKIKQLDQLQIKLQSQMDKNQKLGESLIETQKKLAEKEKDMDELLAWKTTNQETIHNHQNDLEMALLDKEIAEEKADELNSQVEDMKQALELAQTELEILREEMRTTPGEGHNLNSIQLKSLEEQNEKLKQACIKFRDANSILASEKQENVKELATLRNENSELLHMLEITKRQANDANERMLDLRERVDANLEAVNMVEAMTVRNIELEDEKAALQRELEDYQAIHDMDEQLQETQRQTEKELHQDIADRDLRIHELHRQILEEGQHAAELVKLINKYKEKVAQLNEQIQDLKDQELRYKEALDTSKGEDKKLAGMMSQLQNTQGRAFTQIVDAALKGVELEFALKQINYLKAFLPDTFSKPGGDSDSIVLTIAFPRIQAKAQLLARLVEEYYPDVPGGMRREHVTHSHKAEQWAHRKRIHSIAASIAAICTKFETALEQCSMDVLAKIAQMQPEITTQEKTIDNYLELLKQGRLDENTSLDGLNKVHVHFTTVFSVHMSGQSFDTSRWTQGVIAQIVSTINWWKANAQRIMFYMPNDDVSEIHEAILKLREQISEIEGSLTGASHRIPKDKSLKLTTQFSEDIASVTHCLDRVCTVFNEASAVAANQLGVSESNFLDPTRLKEMLHAAVEKTHGQIALERTFEPINKWAEMVQTAVSSIKKVLDNGEMEMDLPEKKIHSPPVIERAMLRRQAAVDAEGLKWQIEKKENEITDLKKTIKARVDDISNYKLRLEMAEKRIENSGKVEGVKAQHWEQKYEQLLTDSKRKEAEWDQTILNLNQEVESLTKQNNELNNKAKAFSRNALMHGVKAATYGAPSVSNSTSGSSTSANSELPYMQHQIVDLQQQLRYSTMELRRLEAEKIALNCRGGVLRVPAEVYGRLSLDHYAHRQGLDKQLKAVFDEAMRMKKEDEVRLNWFKANYLRGNETGQRAEWRQEREAFEIRVSVLRERFTKLARELGHNEPEINAIILGFPRLSPEKATDSLEDLCKKFGIPVAAN